MFGGGYPSLPSMSVEEWFDEQYGGTQPPVPKSRVEGEEEEEEEEKEETEESLKQARDFDEHKDCKLLMTTCTIIMLLVDLLSYVTFEGKLTVAAIKR